MPTSHTVSTSFKRCRGSLLNTDPKGPLLTKEPTFSLCWFLCKRERMSRTIVHQLLIVVAQKWHFYHLFTLRLSHKALFHSKGAKGYNIIFHISYEYEISYDIIIISYFWSLGVGNVWWILSKTTSLKMAVLLIPILFPDMYCLRPGTPQIIQSEFFWVLVILLIKCEVQSIIPVSQTSC